MSIPAGDVVMAKIIHGKDEWSRGFSRCYNTNCKGSTWCQNCDGLGKTVLEWAQTGENRITRNDGNALATKYIKRVLEKSHNWARIQACRKLDR